MAKRLLSICVVTNSLLLATFAIYFFFAPLGLIIRDVRDPALRHGQIPAFAVRWHRQLSDDFATWAKERIASQQANSLSINNISGTEWPIFSAVYFLWATEALQANWQQHPSSSATAPNVYAAEAIEAAAALVADPNHAEWVKQHWGDDYLHQENIFYRMLLIGGLTSYQKLTNNLQYQPLLTDQVHSLSQELDDSPYGLLDDYPQQCYPIDILPAIAVIQRSNLLPEAEQAAFVGRSYRAFSQERLDPKTDLPAYIADSRTGVGHGPARGVGISYMLIWAPELWPDVAQQWYKSYETHFWQEGLILSGVREFSRYSSLPTWLIDVDAGPVVAGYGTAASAFGIGAARTNGRFDHAYPLSVEALAISWPLPNGTLLGPRLLSNMSDAPYVGESALLFNFTRIPLKPIPTSANNPPTPFFLYLCLLLYGAGGYLILAMAMTRARQWRRTAIAISANRGWQLLILWICLLVVGFILLSQRVIAFGLLFLALAQLLPQHLSR